MNLREPSPGEQRFETCQTCLCPRRFVFDRDSQWVEQHHCVPKYRERAEKAEKRLARAEELLEATVCRLRCNDDGECFGCALEADIELFLSEGTNG